MSSSLFLLTSITSLIPIYVVTHNELLCSRYFEEEDEQQQPQLEYIPAPNSPTNIKSDVDSDSSEDPLDAFMKGLEKEVTNCYITTYFLYLLLVKYIFITYFCLTL